MLFMSNCTAESFTFFQALRCKGMFDNIYQDCRLKLRPFRAQSLRLVPLTFPEAYIDALNIEIGGLDYMERKKSYHFYSKRLNCCLL